MAVAEQVSQCRQCTTSHRIVSFVQQPGQVGFYFGQICLKRLLRLRHQCGGSFLSVTRTIR